MYKRVCTCSTNFYTLFSLHQNRSRLQSTVVNLTLLTRPYGPIFYILLCRSRFQRKGARRCPLTPLTSLPSLADSR